MRIIGAHVNVRLTTANLNLVTGSTTHIKK